MYRPKRSDAPKRVQPLPRPLPDWTRAKPQTTRSTLDLKAIAFRLPDGLACQGTRESPRWRTPFLHARGHGNSTSADG